MQIILLSGGSGKRLWPLSNDVRSKQFIKIFETVAGRESMLQRVLRQIHNIPAPIKMTISTSKAQETILRKYVGEDVDISVEPCRRNTFPATALTAAYLHDVKKINFNEPIIICPVDPYVEDNFFLEFKNLVDLANKVNIALIGINPTYPSEKYGYIIPASGDKVSDVLDFKEKPDAETAKKYIQNGGLWNAGVFACKLSFLLEKSEEILKFNSYADLLKNYAELPDISIDYAVVEKEKSLKVLRYIGDWKDVGTWNTLTEVMNTAGVGKVQFDKTCESSHVINETDMPIIAMGLKNIVVAASYDGILVADKVQSGYIKSLVKNNDEARFIEKSWGTYQIIDVGEESLTIKLIVISGQKMDYQHHKLQEEVWNIIEGTGKIILNGETKRVTVGDVIKIPRGVKLTIIAKTNLKIIEIQFGKDNFPCRKY